jgi:hypothetical protein
VLHVRVQESLKPVERVPARIGHITIVGLSPSLLRSRPISIPGRVETARELSGSGTSNPFNTLVQLDKLSVLYMQWLSPDAVVVDAVA